jgi:CheY-like chemotaxis protein
VVAVTASAMAPELERCREAGMNAVVTKPIDSAKFIAVLHELLGRR